MAVHLSGGFAVEVLCEVRLGGEDSIDPPGGRGVPGPGLHPPHPAAGAALGGENVRYGLLEPIPC